MIIFRNPGLIDLEVVKTMGVNVKEGDHPIGRFGTGLKFAIATILRDGGEIEIWRDGECHKIASQPTAIRGKDFDIVTLDGQPLGYTTALGRDWEPWMAFRELATNAKDEAGSYFLGSETTPPPSRGETMVVVHSPGIVAAYLERDAVLLESAPLYEDEILAIHPGETRYIYYRGVRVWEFAKPCRYTYNIIRDIDLTEDRTLKYLWDANSAISLGLRYCTDPEIIREVLLAGEDYHEHELAISGGGSEEFKTTTFSLTLGMQQQPNLNPAAARAARYQAMADMTPGASIALPGHHAEKYLRAKDILRAAGYPVHEMPIVIVDSLGAGIHGMAAHGKIYLAVNCFERGTREVAATILEEYAHLRTGHGDCTRELQNWLFDQLLTQIEARAGINF